MVIPYIKGLSESLKNVCNKHRIQVYFRGGTPIKSHLMAPKDKEPITKESGVIYSYKCDRVECDEEYIREYSRTFGEKFKEHLKTSPQYIITPIENFSKVEREDKNIIRTVKNIIHEGQ